MIPFISSNPGNLIQLAKDWQLTININKCSTLFITTMPQSPLSQYYVNCEALQLNSNLDLGVTISSNYLKRH
jgi:hypothetical protein